MLRHIKKIVVLLGGLCFALIIVEELLERHTSVIYSRHWILDLGDVSFNMTVNKEMPSYSPPHANLEKFQENVLINQTTTPGKNQETVPEADQEIYILSNEQHGTRDDKNKLTDEAIARASVQLNKIATVPPSKYKTKFTNPHLSSDEAEPRKSFTTNNWTTPYNDDNEEEIRLKNSPYIYQEDLERSRLLPPPSQGEVKLVSYYLPWDLDRHSKDRFSGCRYNCQYVNNMSQADIIVFRASAVREYVIPDFYRPKHQRWALFTYDPAVKNYDLNRPDIGSKFNWTITYQLHSDVPLLFGQLQKRMLPTRDFEAVYDKKDREAAWFVSHCPTWSRREQYVERMRQVMRVDIFGGCGNMTCGPIHYRKNDTTECLPMLTNHYKFYLAFENSFCKDYISEKFFKLFKDTDVIPVVRGGFNYKKYLPSGIFVDSSDFKTPEDLARYLLRLGQNKTEYVNMLKRKSQWIEATYTSFQCLVCEALHTSKSTSQFYSNLKYKFNGNPPDCWKPRDLTLLDKTL